MVIKYIGSKRVLVPAIVEAVLAAWASSGRRPRRARPSCPRVLDLFSGTSRVGHALKRAGCGVVANDHNAYAHVLARCYVEADRTERLLGGVSRRIAELNRLAASLPEVRPEDAAPSGGYFHDTFCLKSRFFHPSNGRRIDACRERIAEWSDSRAIDAESEAVLLVSLMEAADRVDSTTGLQMAYLKQWAPRALKPLSLRMPEVLERPPGGCVALGLDAFKALASPEVAACEIAYIDPPYNQHSYLSNYHIWESLVRWDKPEVYGAACKRVDCRERKSVFNRSSGADGGARAAIRRIVLDVPTRIAIVSFNDEGFISRAELEMLLRERFGDVAVIGHDFKRYVGAQIGIYNPRGEKVGKIGRLRNTEYLFVAGAAAGIASLAAGAAA